MGFAASGPSADDRILPITRIVAALVILFLVAVFAILDVLATSTERLIAWKRQPTTLATLLAAAYAGGIHFFAAVLIVRNWHRVKVGRLSARRAHD